jgi:hypothetical protein
MHRTPQKGTNVTHPERSPKPSSPEAGTRAPLRALFHLPGTGVPSAGQDHRVSTRLHHFRRRVALSAAATVALAIGLFPTVASAAQQYPFLGQIGPLEHESSSLAVAPSSGDLFRSTGGPEENFHAGPPIIDVRDSSGAPLATWTGASTPAGSFGGVGQRNPVVALDESTSLSDPHAGDLYVLDSQHHVIDVFSSPATGEHYLCQITGAGSASTSSSECDTSAPGVPGGSLPGNTRLTAIAVDPATGDLYVSSESNPTAVFEFSPAGAYLSQVSLPGSFKGPSGLAVDDHSGDLLVQGAEVSGVVGLFTLSTGAYLESWTGSALTNPPGTPDGTIGNVGLAVDAGSGDVYVGSGFAGVYQFDPAGPYLGRIAGIPGSKSFEELHAGAEHPAIDQATHRVYVAVSGFRESLIDVFGDQTVLVPDVVPAPANPLHAYSATLNATVNPDGLPLTSCRFEYVTEAAFNATHFATAKTLPCAQSLAQIGEGNSPKPVSAEIGCQNPVVEVREGKCLKPETAYDFRLVAANANESPNPISYGSYSAPQLLETLPIPLVLSGQATEVDPTTATLSLEANPKGHPTTCEIEYGTSKQPYEHTIPCEPAGLGSGFAPVTATAHLENLTAGATYHWRAVISNVAATVTGPDHTFVYLHSQAEEVDQSCPNQALREENASRPLPDCRAYEMVSPPAKNGAAIGRGFLIGPDLSAPSGERVFGFSIQAFAGAGSSNGDRSLINGDPFSFDRTAAGWAATALAPPATLLLANTPYGLNPETGATLFAGPTSPQDPDHFLVRQSDGEFLDLGPITPPAAGPTAEKIEPLGTSADLSHVLYTMEPTRWPFDATNHFAVTVYEYAGPSSEPLLPGVSGGPGSTDLISVCGTNVGGFRFGGTANGALSADGSTVYFTAAACAHGSGANAHTKVLADTLYARIDGESPEARTVLISGRSPTGCSGACATSPPSGASFWGASADGSRAFFASTQQLTDEASQDPNVTDSATKVGGCESVVGHGGCNLYLYQDPQQQPLSGTHLIDVSAGDTSGQGPGVQGLMALSPDASHAYFVATGVLASNPGAATDPQTGEPQQAQAGADNLYLYQRDATFPAGHTTFLASLPQADAEEWNRESNAVANLTPDGRFLLFQSHASLTPDDTRPEGPAQLYRYDAQSEELHRVSVGERGFNDDGNASIADAQPARPSTSPNPSISADGSSVFFESPAGLTPGALDNVQIGTNFNHEPTYAENIYEWHEGEVRLISDGRDTASVGGGHDSVVHLIGASSDGNNVFFTTDDPLVPADSDTQLDIYDARAGGGFPAPAEPPICREDVCKGQGTEAGPFPGPATPAFNGPEEGPNHPQKPPKHHRKKHGKKHHKAKHKRANANRGGVR